MIGRFKLEILNNLCYRKGPGHLFNIAHLYLILKILEDEQKPIGRYELSKRLNLGAGSTRTILKRLTKAELIKSEDNKGQILTEKGSKTLEKISKYLIAIHDLNHVEDLSISNINIGCQVRNVSEKFKIGIKLRDAAIKIGALGITTMIYTGNNFKIPGLEDEDINVKNGHADLYDEIFQKFNDLKKNDILLICTALNKDLARLGAISAVFSLLKK